MEEKYTKVIAVGEEAINYLEDIKHNLQKNASFENIKVTKFGGSSLPSTILLLFM